MKLNTTQLTEAIGWLGVAAIIAAYVGINFGYLAVHAAPYQLLNLFGAIAVGYDAFAQKNYQPMVLNFVFGSVAIFVLTTLIF